ncbi:MAG: tRNA preQ1(34) S-adenosylmethionine ribosyltransferase-isomerase QueA [Clostridiales bacterium]|nr:tRNA preQ1(34) S-adenosylmethionine ribosyltransferase-isomerase QueA [Clostridiales bacterium]
MDTSDFYYELPEHLIAQEPIYPRDASRLMILKKDTDYLKHDIFRNIINYLNPDDCLVLNDTRVIPARLFGIREDTGSVIEFLLLKRKTVDLWETMVRPGKKAKIGNKFIFPEGQMTAEVIDIVEDGNRIVKFTYDGLFENILDRLGKMPLPPYIKEELKDKERYQTVYSKYEGSAAAPTAGLHFTEKLLKKIEHKGVNLAYITLHVGLGTFRPVKVRNIEEHSMHSEYYEITKDNADIINNTKKSGNKVICVGTTSTRAIESAATSYGVIYPQKGWTDIFIYPGYKFKCTDGLITNFHLPESTLLMLVSALAGKEKIMNAYEEAIKQKYRFFSFGDAMLII